MPIFEPTKSFAATSAERVSLINAIGCTYDLFFTARILPLIDTDLLASDNIFLYKGKKVEVLFLNGIDQA